MKPVKLSLEKDEEEARKGKDGSGEGRKRERRRREVGRAAASERTVKPPFERNRLGDEFERKEEGETVRRRGCGGGYKHGDGKSLLIS